MTRSEIVILSLPQGQIKGLHTETVYDEEYFSFEGIPYAKPPVGKLRFMAPEPSGNWTGVLDCTKNNRKAPQTNYVTGEMVGSEDCLYLNVYTKKLKSDKPLPVMVWIHGGGFFIGEGTRELFSPDYFMAEDVVLVTLNYRLCYLGFLSLRDSTLNVPGNAGLKDQALALKWVKANIEHFNGDKNNITLFGESAGGAAVHYLMITEQTKGLFHKAILMSGTALNEGSVVPQSDMAYRLASYNGYNGKATDKDVLGFLRSKEPRDLIRRRIINDEERRNGRYTEFGPIIEPYHTANCIIPKHPLEMVKTAWSNQIPIMIGGTSMEGINAYPKLKARPKRMIDALNDPEGLLTKEIRDAYDLVQRHELGMKIKKLHFGEKTKESELLNAFLNFYSIKAFWHGFHRTILARLEYAASQPTFLYRFDFDSPTFNHYRFKYCGTDPIRGASHADDLSYLFYFNKCWKLPKDSDEFKTIKRMIGIWTSFARNSNPNCDAIKPIDWRPLSKENPFEALNISNELEIMDLPEKSKLLVWSSLYKDIGNFI